MMIADRLTETDLSQKSVHGLMDRKGNRSFV